MCRLQLVAALALGCGSHETYPLDQVPISGGTEEQRAAVLRVLEQFQAQVSPSEVRLSKVLFADPGASWSPDQRGGYRAWDQRVRVQVGLTATQTELVTRHELCHALDHQVVNASRAMPDLADRFDVEAWASHFDQQEPEAETTELAEMFAHLCTAGPELSSVLRFPCLDREVLASEAFRWLHHDVWHGRPFPIAEAGTYDASWESTSGLDDVTRMSVVPGLAGSLEAIQVRLGTTQNGHWWLDIAHLDVRTGSIVDGADFLPNEPLEDTPLTTGELGITVVGREARSAVGRVTTRLPAIGSAHRWLLDEGQGWSLDSESCGNSAGLATPFVMGEQAWLARFSSDGSHVEWRAIPESPRPGG